jgi:DNA-binding response OmpR family regulator
VLGVAELLFVEDEVEVRRMLTLVLEDDGHRVTEVGSGEEALAELGRRSFDLVLVDLRLPGMHGFELCRRLRHDSAVPVIVVTAQSDTHDLVVALEAGADDYVTKPVVAKELTARIRALLRRARHSADDGSSLALPGGLELDVHGGEVRRAGLPIALSKTEFRILCELAAHRGTVLSREQLLERIWGYDYLGDSRLVDAHIRRLRAKLDDSADQPAIVQTVRGLGYKMPR